MKKENAPKPEPRAQQTTIDNVAKRVEELNKDSVFKKFRVGKAEDGTTLDITNKSGVPLYRDGQLRIGRHRFVILEQERSVIEGTDVKTRKEWTQFLVETCSGTLPRLYTNVAGKITFEPNEPGLLVEDEERTRAVRQITRFYTEADSREVPTEKQAKSLLDILTKLTPDDELVRFSTTLREEKEIQKIQRDLAQETNRILLASGDEINSTDKSDQITLSLPPKKISITQYKDSNTLFVEVTKPQHDEQGKPQLVIEKYHSSHTGTISLMTTFEGKQSRGTLPEEITSGEQVRELFEDLHSLTDDKIKKEVASRKEIRSLIGTILENHGSSNDRELHASFYLADSHARLTQNKDKTQEIYISIYKNPPYHEGEIYQQTFVLNKATPLEVITTRSGQHSTDSLLWLLRIPASQDQTDYLLSFLKDLAEK